MKFYYDPTIPWEICFYCEPYNDKKLPMNICDARFNSRYSNCPHPCKLRDKALKQRLKDLTMKDHEGIMMGCLTCRYCVFFHKTRKIENIGIHSIQRVFVCHKGHKVGLKKIDKFKCEHFFLKRFVHCPQRNETITCNDCLWDYHTLKDYCKNCEVFSISSNCKLKIKPKQKTHKPVLKLRKKVNTNLKLRRK